MKSFLKTVSFLLILATAFASCKKEDTVKIVHGNVTLNVLVKHHDWPIHYMHVYLKSNTTVWPGRDSTLYESETDTRQDGTCEFTNLYPGNYYLYASGYDPVVETNVLGYCPVVITNSVLVNNSLSVTLYVSE